MWLFVLFLAIPVIEIGLFIQVGNAIGLWPTLFIVILTAVLGTWMIRAQGAHAINQLRTSLNDMRDPTEPLAHGAMILISGALLLTPGFFTDAVGFALLLPPVRSALFSYLRSRVKVQGFSVGGGATTHTNPRGTVIEGEFEEVDPANDAQEPGNSGWTRH